MTDDIEAPASVGRSYNRGYRDGALNHDMKDQFEQHPFERDAYRSGYILGKKEYERKRDESKTPVQKIADDSLEGLTKARNDMVKRFMENPGFVATFGNNPVVEFGDVEVYDKNQDRMSFNPLKEYDFQLSLNVRVRVREEGEIDEHVRVYANRRVEEIKRLRRSLEVAEAENDQPTITRLKHRIGIFNHELQERNLRLTEEGNLESV